MNDLIHLPASAPSEAGLSRSLRPLLAILVLAGLGFANLTERRENSYLQSRTKTRLGEDWKVYAGGDPTGAKDASFNDASWTTTSVPHDMSQPLVGKTTDIDPGNKGWYRKHFTLPTSAAGKRVTLQFDGVYHWCKVYVNGTLVGSQEFGYVSFQVDITNAVKASGDNVIAVWVDNLTQRQSRWYSGTGIYRHVWLTITDPVHVKNWGTAITTPNATAAKSTVKINTEVTNDGTASATRTLRTVICDSTGTPVDSVSSSITVAAGATTKFAQSIDLSGIKLWSPETPYIYNAYTKILDGTNLSDDYVTPFGIRDLQVSSTKGMTINGVSVKLRGACLHHTMIPTGAVVPEAMWVRVLNQLKASGTNSIRTAHNPMSPEFMDLCDRMGMLVMDEWCDKWKTWWAGSQYLDWDKVWKTDLRLFIERDRNHPSVVLWSYGNEVDAGTSGKVSQYEYDMSGTIVPFAKTIDDSRLYTHGVANGFSGDWAGYAKLAQYEDVVGVNYNDGGYANMISLAPNAIFVGTEQYPYGTSWNNAKNRVQVLGEHIWTGMDYLGEVKPMGEPCGFLDACAFRKTWFSYRKSIIGSEPVVKLGVGSPTGSGAWAPPILSESWNESGSKNVVAYSNCQSVSLYLNGTLVGTKTYTAGNLSTSQWTVNWASGTLKVVGSNNGTQVAVDSLITTGTASRIVLKSDRTTLYADGDDLANVEAYVVDAKGNHIWSATNNLKYTVAGAGRALGIGTGDLSKTVAFSDNRNAYEGRAYIPLQSTTTPGSITLTVSSNGLTSGTVTLTTIAQPAPGTSTGVLNRSASRGASISFARKSGDHAMEMGYHLGKSGSVRISVLTPAGREVASFDQGVQAAGFHEWSWNKVPGERAYLIRVKAEGESATRLVAIP
jgi:beta-galactosidase